MQPYLDWGGDTSKLFNCFHILQDNYKACCVIVHDDEQLKTMLTNEKTQNKGVKMDEC